MMQIEPELIVNFEKNNKTEKRFMLYMYKSPEKLNNIREIVITFTSTGLVSQKPEAVTRFHNLCKFQILG